MKIQVQVDKTIRQVQEEFNAAFPYLKLVFFKRKHDAYEGSHAKDIIDDLDRTLGSLENKPHSGTLSVEAEMPTWQVERLFEEAFGLHVQVFRKSGNLWLETSRTDDLTLDMQNAKGKAGDHIERFKEDEPMDFREQP